MNKYLSFSAIHILHTYQLAEEKYKNIVMHPRDLILSLYMDPRILRKSSSVLDACPGKFKKIALHLRCSGKPFVLDIIFRERSRLYSKKIVSCTIFDQVWIDS